MNNFNYIKKLSLRHEDSQKGSTLAVGVALGALMIGGTVVAIATSSRAKTNVISDEGGKQAQAIAEGGISRTLNLFTQGNNKYLLLANYQDGNWTMPDPSILNTIALPKNPCFTTDNDTKVALGTNTSMWLQKMVENNDFAETINKEDSIGKGGINTLFSYTYQSDSQRGELVIDGGIQNTESQARYQANFAVKMEPPKKGGGAAALIASNMQLNQLDVFAETVLCTDPTKCNKASYSLPVSSCQNGELVGAESHRWLEESLGITNNGKVRDRNNSLDDSEIIITSTIIPPIPTAPVGAKVIDVEYSTAGARRNTVVASNDPVAQNTNLTVNLPNASVDMTSRFLELSVAQAPKHGTLTHRGQGSNQYYTYTVSNPSSITTTTIDSFSFNYKDSGNIIRTETRTVKILPNPINPSVKGKSNKADDTTFTANGTKTATSTTIDMANSPYSDSHHTETIDGQTYDIWYIQVNNYSGNNDLDVRVDNLNAVGNPNHKKQIRLYIGGNLDMRGNASIQAVDGSGKRITGTTEEQLEQIASLRIIGGFANPNMTQPTSQTWNFKGTTCTMGLIHAPMATINYSGGGNGCGSSGGENPITLNNVFGVTGTPFGGSTATPNHFGSMWVNTITPNNSNSMALYENLALSDLLSNEFGNQYFVGDNRNLLDVKMGESILSLTRLPITD